MKNTETEHINHDTANIDLVGTQEMLVMINNEDMKVAKAVQECIPQITVGVDMIVRNFMQGGRLFYVGAGTSGRLGVLDASECPPTFNTDPHEVVGIIAGGDKALRDAVEGAEDSEDLAISDFKKYDICDKDTVVGVSACGNARYVVKFLEIAKLKKCKTIAISCNQNGRIREFADCYICAHTGAEAISGSTRMKAGTAQKMILNMLSTASMVKIGKTYHNLMIDLKPTNDKLKRRAITIVAEICGCKEVQAREVLEANGYKVKHAVLMILHEDMSFEEADHLLKEHHGVLRRILCK